jgi:hypothetical protein
METFPAGYEHSPEYARNREKQAGGQVRGSTGPGVPEAILVACPFLPVRIPDVLRRALDGAGVPHLVLEPDDDAPPSRSKIRVEAFRKSLRPADLF